LSTISAGGRVLFLSSLAEGALGVTPAFGLFMAEAAAVCFDERGHRSPVSLQIEGDLSAVFDVHLLEVTRQMKNAHHDKEEATEYGACAIAALVLRDLVGLTILRRSKKGTGFDYWLAPEDSPLFRNASRLEVSGIRRGGEREIRARVRAKERQIAQSSLSLPVYLAVVEFGAPRVRIVMR
jgi:hypothetical protein